MSVCVLGCECVMLCLLVGMVVLGWWLILLGFRFGVDLVLFGFGVCIDSGGCFWFWFCLNCCGIGFRI